MAATIQIGVKLVVHKTATSAQCKLSSKYVLLQPNKIVYLAYSYAYTIHVYTRNNTYIVLEHSCKDINTLCNRKNDINITATTTSR